jgi:hypothetical protein
MSQAGVAMRGMDAAASLGSAALGTLCALGALCALCALGTLDPALRAQGGDAAMRAERALGGALSTGSTGSTKRPWPRLGAQRAERHDVAAGPARAAGWLARDAGRVAREAGGRARDASGRAMVAGQAGRRAVDAGGRGRQLVDLVRVRAHRRMELRQVDVQILRGGFGIVVGHELSFQNRGGSRTRARMTGLRGLGATPAWNLSPSPGGRRSLPESGGPGRKRAAAGGVGEILSTRDG